MAVRHDTVSSPIRVTEISTEAKSLIVEAGARETDAVIANREKEIVLDARVKEAVAEH